MKKTCKAVNAYDEKTLMDSEESSIPKSSAMYLRCTTILAKARLKRAKAAGVIVPLKEIQVPLNKAREILDKKGLILTEDEVTQATDTVNRYSLQNMKLFASESQSETSGTTLARHLIAAERLAMLEARTKKA